jgi:two-component system NarL family sensor kinase
MLGRIPLESTRPVVTLAIVRVAATVVAIVLTLALGFPFDGRLAAVLTAVALPWGLFVFWLVRRSPDAALGWAVAVGDFVVLLAIELAVPDTFGVVRFAALFFIAVQSNLQGERRGLALAVGGSVSIVVASALRGDQHVVAGGLLALYEYTFVLTAVAASVLLGRLHATESASRVRARGLTRRTLEAEREARRRVAESIHDGPIQDLIGLDLVLSAVRQAADGGHTHQLDELIDEAHMLASRNVQSLRDEIVDLGPYAFEELSYESAVSKCAATWQRRYSLEVMLQLERLELAPEIAAELFAITQEAVSNAGRHSSARNVTISMRSLEGDVELRVMDDGDGFGDVDPLGPGEPGHLGLASMRERAELLDGRLAIESTSRGTKLVVRAPLERRGILKRARVGR